MFRGYWSVTAAALLLVCTFTSSPVTRTVLRPTEDNDELDAYEMLLRKTYANSEEGSVAYGLFASSTVDELSTLLLHKSDSIAIRAAWETAKRSFIREKDKNSADSAVEAARFVGYVEGRIGCQAPAAWLECISSARIIRLSRQEADGTAPEYLVQFPNTAVETAVTLGKDGFTTQPSTTQWSASKTPSTDTTEAQILIANSVSTQECRLDVDADEVHLVSILPLSRQHAVVALSCQMGEDYELFVLRRDAQALVARQLVPYRSVGTAGGRSGVRPTGWMHLAKTVDGNIVVFCASFDGISVEHISVTDGGIVTSLQSRY